MNSALYEKLLREAEQERAWGWTVPFAWPTPAKQAAPTPELDLIFGALRW